MNEINAAVWRSVRQSAGWPTNTALRRRELLANSAGVLCLQRGLRVYYWLKNLDDGVAADKAAAEKRAAVLSVVSGGML